MEVQRLRVKRDEEGRPRHRGHPQAILVTHAPYGGAEVRRQRTEGHSNECEGKDGDYFVHRTGHSIDRDLHGSGPHLDNFETADERALIPGVGFSVEPGVYLPGRFGIRSELNVSLRESGPQVTPKQPQQDLLLV